MDGVEMRLKNALNRIVSFAWLATKPGFDSLIAAVSSLPDAPNPNPEPRHYRPMPSPAVPPTYAQTVGTQMRFLRESVLQLSLRQMATFLGLEQVGRLERYENGEDEYPLTSIKRIEAFFNVREEFTSENSEIVFEQFCVSTEACIRYLQDGYSPMLVCCPFDRNDLFCYQIFHRRVDGFTQIACAGQVGSFASNGGGRLNIQHLIDALFAVGKTPSQAYLRVMQANAVDWTALSSCQYYSARPFARGWADFECRRIFDDWYEESEVSRRHWAVYALPQ